MLALFYQRTFVQVRNLESQVTTNEMLTNYNKFQVKNGTDNIFLCHGCLLLPEMTKHIFSVDKFTNDLKPSETCDDIFPKIFHICSSYQSFLTHSELPHLKGRASGKAQVPAYICLPLHFLCYLLLMKTKRNLLMSFSVRGFLTTCSDNKFFGKKYDSFPFH